MANPTRLIKGGIVLARDESLLTAGDNLTPPCCTDFSLVTVSKAEKLLGAYTTGAYIEKSTPMVSSPDDSAVQTTATKSNRDHVLASRASGRPFVFSNTLENNQKKRRERRPLRLLALYDPAPPPTATESERTASASVRPLTCTWRPSHTNNKERRKSR